MIVNGINIPDPLLRDVLARFGAVGFALRDLQAELENRGISGEASYEAAKRLLQRERKAGTFLHDAATGEWKTADAIAIPPMPSSPVEQSEPTRTIPLELIKEPGTATIATAESGISTQDKLWTAAAFIACLAAVLALALINASFAWQVAETESFRVAFVLGLAASDLMRPLLIARGLWEVEQRRFLRAIAAFAVALCLAPVSIISSTAVVSSALHLGAEENTERQEQDVVRMTLRAEYNRLTELSEKAWGAWENECSRGGCGNIALELEATAKELEVEARKRFDALMDASESANEQSSFLSRTATAFQRVGLFGGVAIVGIPLLIALSLEIAALFGPGILLTRRRRT